MLGLFAAAVAVVVGLPSLLGPTIVQHAVANLNRRIDGRLELARVHLAPSGRIAIEGLTLVDGAGRLLVTASHAVAETSLLGMLTGTFDGALVASGVEYHLWPEQQVRLHLPDLGEFWRPADPSEWFEPPPGFDFHRLPAVRGTIEIADSHLFVHDESGNTRAFAFRLGGVLEGLDQPAHVRAFLSGRNRDGSAGRAQATCEFTLSDGDRVHRDSVRAVLEIACDGLDLTPLLGCDLGSVRLLKEPGQRWRLDGPSDPNGAAIRSETAARW